MTQKAWIYFQPNFTNGHPDDQDILAVCPECHALVLEGDFEDRHKKWHADLEFRIWSAS